MKVSLLTTLVATATISSCGVREGRLLHGTDYVALLAACRRAMASLPSPGPPIDSTVYGIDPGDERFQAMFSALQARTVTFQAAVDSPSVTDRRLPPEILRLEPLFVAVTPDAAYVALCGSGLSCSANASRPGAGLEVLSHLKGGQPDCKSLTDGLWYCHE